MKKVKAILCSFCFAAMLPLSTQAGMVSGFTSGPDSSFSINMTFTNDGPSDITQIQINGSTGDAFPIVWDSAGTASNTTGATETISGVDTQLLTIDFTAGFGAGESFSLLGMDPDGVPAPIGVMIGEMIGVEVFVTFADQSTWLGQWVDDPAVGAGLKLEVISTTQVPEPSTYLLFGGGLLLLLGLRARRRNNA